MDLRVRCDRRPDAQKGETDPRKLYYDSNVYSGMLEWSPVNQQEETFRGEEPRPVVDDVLLTKLRPGQVSHPLRLMGKEANAQMVDMHCFARKGTGADHSKWSPVGKLSSPRN
jgi:DNA-directed RNA polymerase I and III subunit RPAC1